MSEQEPKAPQPEGGATEKKPRPERHSKHTIHHRHPQARKINKKLILGLVAGAVAIVAVFVVVGTKGGMSEAEIGQARACLEKALAHGLAGTAAEALPILDVKEMVRTEKTTEYRQWAKLSEDQKKAMEKVACDLLSENAKRTGVDAAGLGKFVQGMTTTPQDQIMRVKFEWKVGDVVFNAAVKKVGANWILEWIGAVG